MSDKSIPDDTPATMLSRSGISSPLGKLEEVMRTSIDEVTAAAFRKGADALDQTSAELLRDLIYVFVHKKTMIEMIAEHRRGLLNQQAQELSNNQATKAERDR